MSKLAHSSQEHMDEIERQARDEPDFPDPQDRWQGWPGAEPWTPLGDLIDPAAVRSTVSVLEAMKIHADSEARRATADLVAILRRIQIISEGIDPHVMPGTAQQALSTIERLCRDTIAKASPKQ
jgi:hypothetical protein